MRKMATYQPKRSSARWLEGAPPPVLAVYDSGPNHGIDRYTVLYGPPLWDESMGRNVPYVGMNAVPFHPQGFAQYGEMPSQNRGTLGKKIRFTDLPEDCKRLVAQDCGGVNLTNH
jgi:hypothetical protein